MDEEDKGIMLILHIELIPKQYTKTQDNPKKRGEKFYLLVSDTHGLFNIFLPIFFSLVLILLICSS